MSSFDPFRYPPSRLVRRQRPPNYASYRDYKPFLRLEFGRQCVYCRMPDGPKTPASFGVDHYKPQSKFPELKSRYSNLLYCCNACNSLKRDFWPTPSQLKRGVYIPSPCTHKMSHHLRFQNSSVRAVTTAGKWTVDLLDLNRAEEVTYRGFLLRQIERTYRDWMDFRVRLGRLKKALKASPTSQVLIAQQAKMRAAFAAADTDLKRLTGAA